MKIAKGSSIESSSDQGEGITKTIAGLAVDDTGDSDDRVPLVLLHGLSFDRRMWRPSVAALRRTDPRRRVVALDLPGHGDSPGWPSYTLESVAQSIHRAVEEAQLESPVVVGHSISAVIATIYAARYPTRGVINVDQSLEVAPFAHLIRSLADQLHGPGFAGTWEMIAASMHIELLDGAEQELVRSTSRPRQDLILAYWQELFDRPVKEIEDFVAVALAALRASAVPYLVVAGAEPESDYQKWLGTVLPQATVTVWPGSGHFPQVAHPDLFAECLASTACWPTAR